MSPSDTLNKDKKVISSMFDSIAPDYDFLNHTLSFQVDRSWRRKLIKIVKESGAKYVLDLACGTGDVTIGLHRQGIEVVGLDISSKMLELAAGKCERLFGQNPEPPIILENGPADAIPFPDNTFDAVTISFGIRNFDKRATCINEILRVLKPGGIVAILEFTIPTNAVWESIYTFYFRKVLPLVGRMVSNQKAAYQYLPESAFEFPQRETFCMELTKGGFTEMTYRSLSGGIACLYLGKK